MTGITDTGGVVVSGAGVASALTGVGAGGAAVQTLHMNPAETSAPMIDARTTPMDLQQANPYGVGVNIDYMA